ncbi:hypothetical protein [Actinoalloteichus hymeniacidonis]|uniref:Uncharacterized protein n=1 Tax=Actinoalloteichus hymeniacidonis TaxID=340345 RepID=A0AAC9MZZ0_9PSEU|nr:hypothetical protein [Actinoalloteichus hymeniacidonis]AOS64426.1 hypothetical protein TL08_18145 [Actinoalloteichus hymeniacidonis]MBB5907506.1 hypothetical protein [Actinoalloteichus hymeniacidonis]
MSGVADAGPPHDEKRRFTINEDWAATGLGLLLLVLTLLGVIPVGLVP